MTDNFINSSELQVTDGMPELAKADMQLPSSGNANIGDLINEAEVSVYRKSCGNANCKCRNGRAS